MRRETVKRITYMAIGLLIIVAASGCIGEKAQDKAPAKTPGVTPKATETPAPQQTPQQAGQPGVLKENEINSSETDLAQLEAMISDMNMEDNISFEVNDLTFQ